MIPRADITNAVQPIASVDAPAAIVAVADAKQEAFSRLVQIAIGQQLQGKVLSTYNDGSYLVRIANTAARMVLPTATRAGDSLLLTMVSKDPRPTFLLTETIPGEEESSSVSLSAAGRKMEKELQTSTTGAERSATTVDGRNTLVPETDDKTPQTAPQSRQESAPATLSSAGKLIDAILHTADPNQASKAIESSTPLVNTPVNASQLASALHDTISFSGTFYESHVAAWAEGKRPLDLLLKEPQADLGRQAPISTADLLSSADQSHKQLAEIINIQLNTLEQHRILWHGEVWPGQQMEWEISQEPPDSQSRADQEDSATAAWHSVVKFELAHLGTVSASIRLVDKQIHMQVRTDNDNSARLLRRHGNQLADSMAAAGTSLDSLIVKHDGES
ncbi:hypothetical protein FHW67_000244 [Herbaspirillum sp. Sphag1AN]|uniref:flagellar hook-length control protein FliK n=1 Tax=unclassified Herbaspirillum TaxID=2624150 RepID=UPI001618FE15|nr:MULTISPECIES: flagellar hook-length control protein FliK [unclassified Herbaspirillum]MBB3211009.1 hypothetical protein [Herbaspirillum sp. Sphag1AN]MBB3244638.1 hypothetical protein [Herbaspirillum sp. Sphag64]